MSRKQINLLRSFVENRAGIAAVEFVFLSPVLLLMSVVAFDAGRFALATQRVEAVANSVAEMIAQTAPSSPTVEPGDGALTDSMLNFIKDSAMFTFPDVISAANQQGVAWQTLLVVNMASVKFTVTPSTCTSNCTYKPQVVWSTGWRTCGSNIVFAPDAAAVTPTTLPTDLQGPNSQIVVDISYTFQPTFGAGVLPTIPIQRTAYLSPRNVRIVETSSSTLAPNCPGVL